MSKTALTKKNKVECHILTDFKTSIIKLQQTRQCGITYGRHKVNGTEWSPEIDKT